MFVIDLPKRANHISCPGIEEAPRHRHQSFAPHKFAHTAFAAAQGHKVRIEPKVVYFSGIEECVPIRSGIRTRRKQQGGQTRFVFVDDTVGRNVNDGITGGARFKFSLGCSRADNRRTNFPGGIEGSGNTPYLVFRIRERAHWIFGVSRISEISRVSGGRNRFAAGIACLHEMISLRAGRVFKRFPCDRSKSGK